MVIHIQPVVDAAAQEEANVKWADYSSLMVILTFSFSNHFPFSPLIFFSLSPSVIQIIPSSSGLSDMCPLAARLPAASSEMEMSRGSDTTSACT